MFVLFAIALTFFTVSRIQLRTSTNVGNTVRAELLGEAATALAINMLKKDSVEHPDVTSTDHAWTTYFNGLWAAGKPWAFPGELWVDQVSPLARGSVPRVFYHDALYDGMPIQGVQNSLAPGNLKPNLYVPRAESAPLDVVRDDTQPSGWYCAYDANNNRFVVDSSRDGRTAAEIIDKPYPQQFPDLSYCDVDNDGDGKKDSIWIPLAQDFIFEQVGLDFNLDRPYVVIEPPAEDIEAHKKWVKGNEARAVVLFYDGTYEPRTVNQQRWLLTAPINGPDNVPITLYNLNLAGFTFPRPEFDTNPTGQDAQYIDAIDNDYDGIINYHIEYYTPIPPRPVTDEERKKRIVPDAEFERLKTLGFTEISQAYLDPGLGLRICTTGEPMCELAGRAAILIRDEASKVNMNAAGAHYVDTPTFLADQEDNSDLWPAGLAASTSTSVFTPYWRTAFASGASTGEFLTRVLPRVDEGRALEFWNLLTGAPNGSMRSEDFSAFIPAGYVYDVLLPGYGFVDDNANALLLAINGIDDNGNGLIDEGTNPGINLTPEEIDGAWAYAYRAGWIPDPDANPPYVPPANLAVALGSAADIAREVYQRFILLGVLEGVDEPAEFQYNYPVRNKVAEKTESNASIGDYGDKPLPTREYLKRAVLNEEYGGAPAGTASGALNRLRPFITIDSGARNNRTTRDEEGNIETLGPKLNYNLASAAQMAKAFIEEWKLDEALVYHGEDEDGNPLDPYAQLGYRYLPDDVNRYLSGDMRPDEQEVFPFNAFLAGMRIEGVNQSGVSFDLGGAPRPLIMPLDPRLQAMQLAVNIADAADTDYARTELSTADLQQIENDPWWYVYEFNRLVTVEGRTPEQAAQEAKRPISYTVAGAEAIRINEIMVRPVRRIEAEIYGAGGVLTATPEARYDPNIPFDSSFDVTRQTWVDGQLISAGGVDYAVDVADGSAWRLEPDDSVPGSGVIGSGAAVATNAATVELVPVNGGTPKPLPNIVEFKFGPSPQLPPGRYYLTVNIRGTDGSQAVTVENRASFKYAVKYSSQGIGSLPVAPMSSNPPVAAIPVDPDGNSIVQDVLGLAGNDVDWATLFSSDAEVGFENQKSQEEGTESGLLFLSGEQATLPDVPDPPAVDPYPYYRRGFQAYTVTIPRYTPDPAQQVYLHVAIYMDPVPASQDLSINFFDFSQEPDHEWVEIENVSDQPVDLSDWQLTVGAPDSQGNLSTGDAVEMEVPAGTVIDSLPPYNRLLLAVSAFSPPLPPDEPGPAEQVFKMLFQTNPFLWNGIGQVGTPGHPIYPFPDDDTIFFNAGDTTVPLIPARLEGIGDDGRGERTGPSPFEASDAALRIVQLKVRGLNAELDPSDTAGSKTFIGNWVLRGGVFPNYPEHDAVDNDYDSHLIGLNDEAVGILGRDGIDHNGDGGATGPAEGIDEAQAWMDTPGYVAAGSFNVMQSMLLSNWVPPVLYPDPADVLLSPEWKEFIERRFSPGDNVFVSLYQGAHHRNLVVDRITYTERDVINRCIDDGMPATYTDTGTGATTLIRTPLHYNPDLALGEQPYLNFWPDNTMGLDFYRSLERKKHPLYNGDRFGTRNRWQATDGNYDDWSHDPVVNIAYYWYGSPLARNDAAWGDTESNGPELLEQLALLNVRNRPFESPGDLLSLPYYAMDKGYVEYGAGLSANVVTGFQPADEPAGVDIEGLMDAGGGDAIYLSPGAAQFRLTYPVCSSQTQLDGLLEWDTLVFPQGWRPHFLYWLGAGDDPADVGAAGYAYYVSGGTAPLRPPDDTAHWLFNTPQMPVGVDTSWLLPRWPIGLRAVLFVSGNVDGFNPDQTGAAGAAGMFTWDASAGLQDGNYDIYIDTGLKMMGIPDPNDPAPNAPASPLTQTGAGIREALMRGVPPQFNVTLYTDNDGNGVIETGNPADPTLRNEGVALVEKQSPNSAGYLYCGSFPIHNKKFAVKIENRSTNGVLNTFAGVVLTPRSRTQGRLNVNTVETRLYEDYDNSGDITRRLNVLAGIPGVFEEYPAFGNFAQYYSFSTMVDVSNTDAYSFGLVFRCRGNSCYLGQVQKMPGAQPIATLYKVIDGEMTALNSGAPDDIYRVGVNININDFGDQWLLEFVAGATTVAVSEPILNNPLSTGTFGLVSATGQVGFFNPEATFLVPPFTPGAISFSRGWSGLGWVISDGEYRFGGGSTSTLFTGYDTQDRLEDDMYTTPTRVIPPENEPRPPFVRAERIENERPVHWDGRYYKSVMDLYENVDKDGNLSRPLYAGADYASLAAQLESAWRLSRSANLLTTRSDIFEILVTVQAGYGQDVDGDSIINYRNPEEFTVTSERKTRTVYERQ